MPARAPRWTTLIALFSISGAAASLWYPRWKLIPLLGGGNIFSKRSIAFLPGKLEAACLAAAGVFCVSLLFATARPAPRTAGALLALAGAFVSSMSLAKIPNEAVGYSLSPTIGVRLSQVFIGASALALLIPYGSVFEHRILSPESREATAHPLRGSPPKEFEMSDEEPG